MHQNLITAGLFATWRCHRQRKNDEFLGLEMPNKDMNSFLWESSSWRPTKVENIFRVPLYVNFSVNAEKATWIFCQIIYDSLEICSIVLIYLLIEFRWSCFLLSSKSPESNIWRNSLLINMLHGRSVSRISRTIKETLLEEAIRDWEAHKKHFVDCDCDELDSWRAFAISFSVRR